MSKFGSPVHKVVSLETAQARSSSTTEPVVRLNILRSIQVNEFASDSEDDISLVGVSDSEPEPEGSEYIQVPKENVPTNNVDSAKKLSAENSPVLNKRALNTLWKLYRNAGETVEDVITRLFNLSEGKWNWADILSDDDRLDSSEDEIIDRSSRIIDKESIYNGLLQNLIDAENDQMNQDCKDTTCTNDFLDIAMSKSPKIRQLEKVKVLSSGKENQNHSLGVLAQNRCQRESKVRATFEVPRLKPITTAALVSQKPRRARRKRKLLSARRSKRKESACNSLDEEGNNGPIIRDMYGVRTVSYDLPPPKEDKQSKRILRLSEDSHSDSDNEENKGKPAASFKGEMVAHVTATGVRIVRKRAAPGVSKDKQIDIQELAQYGGANLSSDSESDGENNPSSLRPKRRKIAICERENSNIKKNQLNNESTKASSPKSRKRSLISLSESSWSSSTSTSSSSDGEI